MRRLNNDKYNNVNYMFNTDSLLSTKHKEI